MKNQQAQAAGNKADDIIKSLANPAADIETEQGTVEVLDTVTQVTPVQPQADSDNAGNWESRFKGYKASTDKTLHTLRQQASHFDLMQSENELLKKQLEESKAHIPTTPDEMLELFSQEEVNGFKKMLDGKVGGLEGEVARLKGELDHVKDVEASASKQAAHNSVVEAVARSVPNYSEIDRNPVFAEWMKQPDDYGNIRYDMLVRAKESNPPDIGRLVQFYVDFTAAQTRVESPQKYTQQELNQVPTSTPSNTTEKTQPRSNTNWDQAMISQLYKDKATGKISAKVFKELEEDMYASRR